MLGLMLGLMFGWRSDGAQTALARVTEATTELWIFGQRCLCQGWYLLIINFVLACRRRSLVDSVFVYWSGFYLYETYESTRVCVSEQERFYLLISVLFTKIPAPLLQFLISLSPVFSRYSCAVPPLRLQMSSCHVVT